VKSDCHGRPLDGNDKPHGGRVRDASIVFPSQLSKL
jgi:hypothetical protein